MPKTRAEFVELCLTNLGIIAEGQSVSPEDVQKMDKVVGPALSLLSDLQIYYVSDAGELGPSGGAIEDSAFLPLGDWVANWACSKFNLPADQKMQALSTIAQGLLITLAAPSRTLRTLRVDPALTPRRIGYYRGGI